MAGQDRTVDVLLEREGKTYAAEAEIRLRDAPQPLYQLLVLATLLAARISSTTAVEAARELFAAGYKSPDAMAKASWQDRVDALDRGHYQRYDERTSSTLGDAARLVADRFGGDLRRLRKEAGGDVGTLKAGLKEVPGISDVGANIFLREVQGVWPEVRPFLDKKAMSGAERIGLPSSSDTVAGLVRPDDLARLAAGLVRVALDRKTAEAVKADAGS